MKFVLFVEGETEKQGLPDFFKRWLDPLLPRPVGIKIIQFKGVSAYNEDIEAQVDLRLSGIDAADIIAGIGLLDLYGCDFIPDRLAIPAERYTWAKDHLERRVGNPRFRQHFAVHEIEAWFLAQPEILPEEVKKALPDKAIHRPETVNFDEPPGKLLIRLYQSKLRRKYKKVTDGTGLFLRLSPTQAYQKCPYLRNLLDDMLSLAQQALQRA